jgi:hypothetical protein
VGLPRRQSRLVHIDGLAYRWLATPHWRFEVNEEGEQWRKELLFADLYVESRLVPSCQLRLRLFSEWLQRWGRDPLDRRCIDPPLVRRAVRLARLRGWEPEITAPPRWVPQEDIPFLQTPRHLLYAAPLIARVTVKDVTETEPGCASATARVVERLRGSLPSEVRMHLTQPAEQLPRDALAFLRPDPEHPGQLTTWPWYGGLFCVSQGAALLYDDSGEERRWRFRPLRIIREDLLQVSRPLLLPVGAVLGEE